MEELAAVITELIRPSRIDIVRAKRRLLEVLGDGLRHQTAELLSAVAVELGVPSGQSASQLNVELPDRDSVQTAITAAHPVVLALRADVVAHEALAELAAEGMLIPAGAPGSAPDSRPRVSYTLPGLGNSVNVEAPRPAAISDVIWLPNRLRSPEVWRLEPDVFVSDLSSLSLDPRTERALRAALESYRRGIYLAAASLLGTAVEGAWFAAGLLLRTRSKKIDSTVETEKAAQLQAAVVEELRQALPKATSWEADALGTHAGLMRRIRNYGVHPRGVGDDGLEVYFQEDRCGLLFLEAHRHLSRLAQLVDLILTEDLAP